MRVIRQVRGRVVSDHTYHNMIVNAPRFVDAKPPPSYTERKRIADAKKQPKQKLTQQDKNKLQKWTQQRRSV